ncbi:MAG: hypothetical protein IJC68_02530 [Firmicutes bacterium]|nr:hypothetical protein [Bacillota bacterium]
MERYLSNYADYPDKDQLLQSIEEAVPAEYLPVLEKVCFCMITPDAMLQGDWSNILRYLDEKGFRFLGCQIKQHFREWEKEEVYRYNLNEGHATWWFNKEVFSLGPTLGLLVYREDGANVFEEIHKLKGDANPRKASRETIRGRFKAVNTAMNIFHSSDDPVASYREARVFFTPEEINRHLKYFTEGKHITWEYIYTLIKTDATCAAIPIQELSPYPVFAKIKIAVLQRLLRSTLIRDDEDMVRTLQQMESLYQRIGELRIYGSQELPAVDLQDEIAILEELMQKFDGEPLPLNDFPKAREILETQQLILASLELSHYERMGQIPFEKIWESLLVCDVIMTPKEKLLLETGYTYGFFYV